MIYRRDTLRQTAGPDAQPFAETDSFASAGKTRKAPWRGSFAFVASATLFVAGCGFSNTGAPPASATDPMGFGEVVLDQNGSPSYLSNPLGVSGVSNAASASGTVLRALTPQQAIDLFLRGPLADMYRLARETSLAVVSDHTDERGNRYIKLQQHHAGLPVVGQQVVVQTDQAGTVGSVLGHLVPEVALSEQAGLSAETAVAQALVARGEGRAVLPPVLSVWVDDNGLTRLVYEARVAYTTGSDRKFQRMLLSAVDGTVLREHSLIYTALNREMYDLKKVCLKDGSELPGALLCKEGGTTTDASATRAYNSSGKVYWFYNRMWGRDSYDAKGGKLMSSVHATFDNGMGACSGENAAWISEPFNQMVYGDGGLWGLTLKDLTLGFDVAAHEMTHAVTSTTSDLEYMNESGALNEAMSDIMAAAAESWVASGGSQTGNPATWTLSANTWKIGEDVAGLLLASIGALRLMNDPTKDGMSKDYYPERNTGTADNGGVHSNSGIGNVAFYLLTVGGKHPRAKTTIDVRSLGIEKATRIFHLANTSLFTKKTSFQDARYATARAAELLYGRCAAEWQNVHRAWDAVAVPGEWQPCVRPDEPSF